MGLPLVTLERYRHSTLANTDLHNGRAKQSKAEQRENLRKKGEEATKPPTPMMLRTCHNERIHAHDDVVTDDVTNTCINLATVKLAPRSCCKADVTLFFRSSLSGDAVVHIISLVASFATLFPTFVLMKMRFSVASAACICATRSPPDPLKVSWCRTTHTRIRCGDNGAFFVRKEKQLKITAQPTNIYVYWNRVIPRLAPAPLVLLLRALLLLLVVLLVVVLF